MSLKLVSLLSSARVKGRCTGQRASSEDGSGRPSDDVAELRESSSALRWGPAAPRPARLRAGRPRWDGDEDKGSAPGPSLTYDSTAPK
ncbi:hypothetical protein GCM10010353_66830 [Streptomyces chryseus]|nr:hypothetical protein GCM10010353_66830 [Streptomyces chryseus]